MQLLKKYAPGLFLLCVVIVAAAVTHPQLVQGVGAQGAGPAQGLNVNVVNTPLPVTGNIGLSGPVMINNPATNPVLVRNVDGAGTPFQIRGFGDFNSAGSSTFNIATVPAGMRMIIEHTSSSVDVDPGAEVFFAQITSSGAPPLREGLADYLVPQRTGSIGGTLPFVWFQSSHQTFVYADAGEVVKGEVNKSVASSEGFAQIVISGHLVPMP
jgi:hypothetical protein